MPTISPSPLSGRFPSFAEREEIAILHAREVGVREIGRQLGRAPSTISRELRRNAATRGGKLEYRATAAQWHADLEAKRPKVAKLAENDALRDYVQQRLAGKLVSLDGAEVEGPDVPWIGRRTAAGRTGAGETPGARSRSPTGRRWTSPVISR